MQFEICLQDQFGNSKYSRNPHWLSLHIALWSGSFSTGLILLIQVLGWLDVIAWLGCTQMNGEGKPVLHWQLGNVGCTNSELTFPSFRFRCFSLGPTQPPEFADSLAILIMSIGHSVSPSPLPPCGVWKFSSLYLGPLDLIRNQVKEKETNSWMCKHWASIEEKPGLHWCGRQQAMHHASFARCNLLVTILIIITW